MSISTWWGGLDSFEKVLWTIALLFSFLFLIQTIMSFAGGDGSDSDSIGDSDDAVGADDGVDTQYFTIKNLVAFFTMFGWAGIAAYTSHFGKPMSLLVALVAGLAMVGLMILLLRNVGKLKESGTMDIHNALDKMGEVYLPIGAKRTGTGKVQIKVQGSLHELRAITDDETNIATGTLVKVTQIINGEVLLVTTSIS